MAGFIGFIGLIGFIGSIGFTYLGGYLLFISFLVLEQIGYEAATDVEIN